MLLNKWSKKDLSLMIKNKEVEKEKKLRTLFINSII